VIECKIIWERVKSMAPGRKKGGRPLKHKGEPLSKTRSFRVRPRLDELLRAKAEEASRTVSQEIEHRLETSFHDERVALAHTGSDVGALLLRMFYSGMVQEGVYPGWSGDPVRAENFRTAVNGVIAHVLGLKVELPPPWEQQAGWRRAKQLLLASSISMEKCPNEIMFSDLEPLPRELPADEGG
jgi:hypothetical protein